MTDVISIDTSKGLNMTEEEKEAFVQCMDCTTSSPKKNIVCIRLS